MPVVEHLPDGIQPRAYGPAMDKLDDVWVSRDYPVLREVTRLIDQGVLARLLFGPPTTVVAPYGS